ncbi:chaperone SicP [Aeromonas salmonicida]|uniref:chaperone SicP n=1 Tax=Aeromonas salmonicida TaxID=645 RepID=UPI00232FCFC3|nr:chaperone SicP [Aeromonas salmonicida]WCH23625.1 chaperone SicP [Aeromonas salmonicida]
MDKNAELLNSLGRTIGMELTFDQRGQCFLLLDQRLMLSIRSLPGSLIVYGMLGELDVNGSADFWQQALALNLTLTEAGEGSLVLDDSTGAVMLVKHLTSDMLSSHDFAEAVDRFATRLEQLLASLGEMESFDPPKPSLRYV